MRKKRINIVLLGFTFVLISALLISCANNEVVNTVADVAQKTETANWFENNMGWFVGIPIGTVASSILEIVALSKKSKAYTKDLFANSETRKEVKTAIKEISDTNAKVGKFVTKAENIFLNLDKKVDFAIDKAEKTAEGCKEVADKVDGLKTEVEALLQAISLMASQDKDLVSSGVAEKVNKIAESVKTK